MTFLAICFFIYFAPALIASGRQHPSSTAIWFTNFFSGWTGVGWVVCLAWALSAPRPVVLYPAVLDHAPSGAEGEPTRWQTYQGQPQLVCGACSRPVFLAAGYCTMCGGAIISSR